MNLFSFLSTITFIFYIQLALRAISTERKKVNIYFMILAFVMAVYSLYHVGVYSAQSLEFIIIINYIYRFLGISSVSVCLFTIFIFEISLQDIGGKKLKILKILAVMIGVVFAVRGVFFENIVFSFEQEDGIWYEIITPISIWGILYIIYVYLNFFAALGALIRWRYKTSYLKEKKQANCILFGFILSMVAHGFINYIQPFIFKKLLIPRITAISFIILLFAIWHAMLKYNFLSTLDKSLDKNKYWKLFTRREKELIPYIKKGYTNKEIALSLNIAIGTVRKHIDNIKLKTDSKSKIQILDKLFKEEAYI